MPACLALLGSVFWLSQRCDPFGSWITALSRDACSRSPGGRQEPAAVRRRVQRVCPPGAGAQAGAAGRRRPAPAHHSDGPAAGLDPGTPGGGLQAGSGAVWRSAGAAQRDGRQLGQTEVPVAAGVVPGASLLLLCTRLPDGAARWRLCADYGGSAVAAAGGAWLHVQYCRSKLLLVSRQRGGGQQLRFKLDGPTASGSAWLVGFAIPAADASSSRPTVVLVALHV